MDPEVKQLLTENNLMLKKIMRLQQRAQMYRFIYWGIILAFSFGAYYFVQPYINNLIGIYTGGLSGLGNVGDVGKNLKIDSQNQQIQDLLNAFKK